MDIPDDVVSEKKEFECKKWFCTINNPTISGPAFKTALQQLGCVKLLVSGEKGAETGTYHFQGAFEFKTKKRCSQLLAIQPGTYQRQRTKFAYKYCAKADTHVDGPWVIGVPIPRALKTGLEDRLRDGTLAGWQKDLFAICDSEPEDMRDIYWFWSDQGKMGKSSTARYLVDKYGAAFTEPAAKKDMLCSLAALVDPELVGSRKDAVDVRVVVVDIPRADTIDYTVLEIMKNCIFFNTKYRPAGVRYPPIHLIVFANWPPILDSTTLSEDRVHVRCVDTEPPLGAAAGAYV